VNRGAENDGGAVWKLTRSKMAFGLGALILAHEVAIRQGPERPWILLAAMTLCGFASFVKADQLLRNVLESIGRSSDDQAKELDHHGGTGP
jgi:hypothetical protein